MSHLLTYSADYKPTFPEWLAQRHDTTSQELYTLFQATSCHPYREYQNAMSYLRWQYRQDMEYRKLLLASNPFTEEAENKFTNNQGGAETSARQNGG